MMISKKLNEAINAQIGREFGAHFQYIEIAVFFDDQGMKQTAQFFYNQAEEEHEHAMKFLKYIVDTGGQVVIPSIDAPKPDFASAEEAVLLSLSWEQEVTRQINNLMDIAVAEKDYAAQQFLDWFTSEQIEEVSTMDTLLKIVRQIQEKNLFMLENVIARMGEAEDE